MRSKTALLALAAMPFLAVPAQAGGGEIPFPIDGFLTSPVREAFSVAARDPERWALATRDGRVYLEEHGIEVPRDLSVAFLDLRRSGDWLRFSRFDEAMDMYCPRGRMWWNECRKIIRVCDTVDVCIPDGPGTCVLVKLERNCGFVCEESIWDESFTWATRPPFPPR